MIVSPNEMRRQTVGLLRDIEKQIDEVKKEAQERGFPPEELKDANGSWVMAPLLAAKAQAMHTLVLLNEKR